MLLPNPSVAVASSPTGARWGSGFGVWRLGCRVECYRLVFKAHVSLNSRLESNNEEEGFRFKIYPLFGGGGVPPLGACAPHAEAPLPRVDAEASPPGVGAPPAIEAEAPPAQPGAMEEVESRFWPWLIT